MSDTINYIKTRLQRRTVKSVLTALTVENGSTTWGTITGTLSNQTDLQSALDAKQDDLVSGTNIKTINSTSLLGSGDVSVQPTLVSGTNIKTINGSSILGSGDLSVGGSITVGDTQVLFGDGANNPAGDAGLTYNKTTNVLTAGDVEVTDEAYGVGWNGSLEVPTKNAIYDKIENLGGGTPGGSDTQVQFNDGGSFGGDAGMTYNKTTNKLTVGDVEVTDEAYGAGWNSSLEVPTKNAIYDKIQTIDTVREQVGVVFTETWSNLTNWSNVGTPSAAVAGGQLNLNGTASTTTNYIRNNSYGFFNLEYAKVEWTETVGTVGAGTSGIGFGLISQATLGASFRHSVMVNIELSNSGTGAIKWYFGSGGAALTLVQTSTVLLTPVAGNVLNITLLIFPDKYQLSYNINGGPTVHDTFQAYLTPFNSNSTYVVHNAANFSFLNVGGGNSHSIGAVTVTSLHNKNRDYLCIGNSIFSGYGCTNIYNRAVTKLQKRSFSTWEVNARPSNSVSDINVNEIASYNATNLVLLACSNDVASLGAATTLTNLGTVLTALAGISNAAAPSGYSIANGNLYLCTELLRVSTAAIATHNTNLYSNYSASNIINLNPIGNSGGTNMPLIYDATNLISYTYDGVHPNDWANSLMADEIIRFFNLIKKDSYENNDYSVTYIPSPNSYNTLLGSGNRAALLFSPTINRQSYLAFAGIATNSSLMTNLRGLGFENCVVGQSTSGFEIYTNSGLVSGNTYTPTKRLEIDYSGRFTTGTTGNDVYRTTNAGSDVNTHFVIDPASSVTSGQAWGFGTADGFVGTLANGTRRIAGVGLNLTDQTTTAGSETASLSLYVKPSDGALTQRASFIGRQTTLTEGADTAFARIALSSSQYCGGEITVTVQANDATDFQVRTLTFNYSAVNKAGTSTVAISTPVESVAVSTGTLTVTITAVDSGSGNIDFRANATSSLTQTSLRAQCIIHKNFQGTISAQ